MLKDFRRRNTSKCVWFESDNPIQGKILMFKTRTCLNVYVKFALPPVKVLLDCILKYRWLGETSNKEDKLQPTELTMLKKGVQVLHYSIQDRFKQLFHGRRSHAEVFISDELDIVSSTGTCKSSCQIRPTLLWNQCCKGSRKANSGCFTLVSSAPSLLHLKFIHHLQPFCWVVFTEVFHLISSKKPLK